MPDMTTCLWFDSEAEEAARLYTSIFPGSEIVRVDRFVAGPRVGEVLTVSFTLDGRPFLALNGGPQRGFTEAVSIQVHTEDQAETDRYWDALVADGGEESMCGWLKDRFGFSWQVLPRRMEELLSSSEPGVAQRATEAMMRMRRIDVAAMERAAVG
ncbi:Glyoxalase superfamily enzyme, possibly 3-demethylubiquinone-9 3-methyltransferase [Auraticoccus monumenti]|uniref:Glyoxalase superfamily enzyme, possibly 3-demethylubiquinone-9 3-methyltransferase n=2 Tax=Auraticoccus monumenti TaxID=675864 RepID=A0A1G7A8E0_9ACTN|nr:Glyoxalase superfamily enzyme, possibly 3-demethylubiquinone-9 3-methyltransferase [Auraticoccus monumenti]